ncbi:putative Cytoplasm protein [Rhodotorula toruloides]|nr:putative Cytoplasm protein [Rhodotorula toruloides]
MATPADSLEAGTSSTAVDTPPAQPFRPAKLPPPPLYTTSTSRPFSRSALKRQSVMALPSIQHLQHGFAKLGLKEVKKRGEAGARRRSGGTGEDKENEGRIGGLAGMAEEEEDGEEGFEGVLGPEPPKPEVDLRMPWEKEGVEASLRDSKELRREAEEALDVVCDKWGLAAPASTCSELVNAPTDPLHAPREASTVSSASTASTSSQTDNSNSAPLSPLTSFSCTSDSQVPLVLTLLTLTTGAIRTTQQFVLSLPSTSSSTSTAISPDPPQISTASRPRTSLASPFTTAAAMSRSSSSGSNQGNPAVIEADEQATLLAELRKKSLEVLGILREMEGRYRLPVPGRLLADEGEGMVASPLDAEAPALPSSAVTAEAAVEDEPIYRSDIALSSLAAEQDVVREWVRAVNRVLDQTAEAGKTRRSKAADGGPQEEVPEWARKDGWEDSLARAHAIIVTHLSPEQTSSLPNLASDRTGFLDALSDGYLLCLAYNAALRLSSPHPFGFISASSIHPFSSISSSSVEMSCTASSASDGGGGGEKIGQTFRRAENLRLWAGALKHRYNLALAGPPPFDPKVVAARKEEGRRDGLERAVGEWAEDLANEVRREEEEPRETGADRSVEEL